MENRNSFHGDISTIELKDIKYRYPMTERYVLNGVNFSINKGEKVAFVGENGMGKSTAVKLITGMLTPSEGDLLVNGKKISNNTSHDTISTVSQNPARYLTFTINENVFLGDTGHPIDKQRVEQALLFSGLDNLDGEAVLGKDIGGTELSGGQWQKVAIAKAVYHNKDFIILDEPTSNLDPLSEAEIFKKYIALAGNKTVIFVTHRISIAALADRVVVFSGGEIVQDGTHAELIAQAGVYAKLYKEQAQWYDR